MFCEVIHKPINFHIIKDSGFAPNSHLKAQLAAPASPTAPSVAPVSGQTLWWKTAATQKVSPFLKIHSWTILELARENEFMNK